MAATANATGLQLWPDEWAVSWSSGLRHTPADKVQRASRVQGPAEGNAPRRPALREAKAQRPVRWASAQPAASPSRAGIPPRARPGKMAGQPHAQPAPARPRRSSRRAAARDPHPAPPECGGAAAREGLRGRAGGRAGRGALTVSGAARPDWSPEEEEKEEEAREERGLYAATAAAPIAERAAGCRDGGRGRREPRRVASWVGSGSASPGRPPSLPANAGGERRHVRRVAGPRRPRAGPALTAGEAEQSHGARPGTCGRSAVGSGPPVCKG